MSGISKYVQVDENIFHYTQYGQGEALLIAFHGFYQNSTSFQILFESIAHQFTILSIDLPHHGRTSFNATYWTNDQVINLINQLQIVYQKDSISLGGYSIGGRIALSIFPSLSNKVKAIFLCAADGFYMDIYYRLATRNYFGKKIFKSVIQHRNTLIHIAGLLNKLSIIPERTYRFAKKNIDDPAVFQTVLAAWPCFSLLIPKLELISRKLHEHNTTCIIFTGKYDAVIRPKPASRFAAKNHLPYIEMETGHDFTKSKIQKIIAQHILTYIK